MHISVTLITFLMWKAAKNLLFILWTTLYYGWILLIPGSSKESSGFHVMVIHHFHQSLNNSLEMAWPTLAYKVKHLVLNSIQKEDNSIKQTTVVICSLFLYMLQWCNLVLGECANAIFLVRSVEHMHKSEKVDLPSYSLLSKSLLNQIKRHAAASFLVTISNGAVLAAFDASHTKLMHLTPKQL